jgi:type I restriction enzyme, S subunit
LVNSTGAGTLGRVGRWHDGRVFVDGHITVVKANADVVGPSILAYAMLGLESDIEAMATGSTGQTELSPSRLGDLEIPLPSRAAMSSIEGVLLDFEERIASVAREEAVLLQLRDTLLPELLAGRVRVPKADEIVAEGIA